MAPPRFPSPYKHVKLGLFIHFSPYCFQSQSWEATVSAAPPSGPDRMAPVRRACCSASGPEEEDSLCFCFYCFKMKRDGEKKHPTNTLRNPVRTHRHTLGPEGNTVNSCPARPHTYTHTHTKNNIFFSFSFPPPPLLSLAPSPPFLWFFPSCV